MSAKKYIIGSRNSNLALWQAEFVKWLLEEQWPEDEFEIKGFTTTGDDKSIRISQSGGKGLYAKEIEEALLSDEVDLCVHSLKDLPVRLPDGCSLAGVVERGEVRDVFISRDRIPLSDFDEKMKIGTSSLRRRAQLKAYGVRSEIVEIRGNVDTRIQKVGSGEIDGLILAGAGVLRLGHENMITEFLDAKAFVPSPGQGAIAIECRAGDDELRLKIRRIHDDESEQSVLAERSFLSQMGANCTLPLGAWCEIQQFQVHLHAYLSDPEGELVMMDTSVGPVGHPDEIGEKMAERFMAQGAGRILKKIEEFQTA